VRPRALFLVHLNGQICPELPALRALARTHGMAVVEDACHAIGSTLTLPDGERIQAGDCRYSDLTVFSFHPVKTIAMGEGGAVMTNDPERYRKLVLLRGHGMVRDPEGWENRELAFSPEGQPNPWYYEMRQIGFNYRASDLHCALGLSQLAKLEKFVRQRARLVDRYDSLLRPFHPAVRLLGRVAGGVPGWHLYVVFVDFLSLGLSRARFMERLKEQGVGSQVHYLPLHQHPYYQRRHGALDLPGAMAYYARCLSLPLYPTLSDGDQERVVDAIRRALR
ncbi:MAG: DegT/DnrJ/EryC1/StrS family aminotransferase, partial [Magnetococcales bacterium]|nr:DegT/DnrJ/EryC1/StrS family aminotransferase [Magnetococcales bacterium]